MDDHFFRKHINDEDYEKVKQIRDTVALNKKRSSYTFVQTVTTLSGKAKFLETYSRFLRDDTGKVLGLVGTSRDITRL